MLSVRLEGRNVQDCGQTLEKWQQTDDCLRFGAKKSAVSRKHRQMGFLE